MWESESIMRVVLLGSNGQLGSEFNNFLKDKAELFAFTHRELDILDLLSLKKELKILQPDVVINCAAYTKVDLAEKEANNAVKVNAIGTKNVSFASYLVRAKVVYFSTDYVFNGLKNSDYTEFDIPKPISVYGKSKLAGEEFTKEANPNHIIIRISWLYGPKGKNFVKTIISLARRNEKLKIVKDQYGTPTYTLDVVKQTLRLIQMDSVGLYHASNEGETTWFEFAKEIVSNLKLNVEISPITTKEYPTLAKRPVYSVLDNYLLKIENMDIMRHWKVALKDFINHYKEQLLNE